MPPHRPTEVSFIEKYVVNEATECWNWTGSKSRGYGYIRHDKSKMILAHRFSFEHHVEPIPSGMIVRHRCNNCLCVNPDHLVLGTHADNMADMAKAGTRKGKSGPRTYLSDADRMLVVEAYSAGVTVSELARKHGVDRKTIRNINRQGT